MIRIISRYRLIRNYIWLFSTGPSAIHRLLWKTTRPSELDTQARWCEYVHGTHELGNIRRGSNLPDGLKSVKIQIQKTQRDAGVMKKKMLVGFLHYKVFILVPACTPCLCTFSYQNSAKDLPVIAVTDCFSRQNCDLNTKTKFCHFLHTNLWRHEKCDLPRGHMPAVPILVTKTAKSCLIRYTMQLFPMKGAMDFILEGTKQ